MASHIGDNKRIARNTLFLYIRMGIVMLISLYTTRIILRVLGIEDYGIYNVVGGFVSMFGVLSATLTSGINRFYNYEIGKGENGNITDVYNIALVVQILLAIIIFIVVEGIGIWYVNHVMVIPLDRLKVANWLFQFAVVSMILIIIQAPYSSAILAYEKMDYFAIISIVDAVLKLIVCFLIQSFETDRLLTFGWMMLVISFLNYFLYRGYVLLRFKGFKFSFHINRELLKAMLSFSGWSLLNPLAYMARGQGCNLVLNYFLGPIVNAAQGVANQVASAVDQMSNNFSVSFRPQIIQSYSCGEYTRTKRLMYSMSKICFFLHALFAVPIIFEINGILSLWLGKDSVPDFAPSFACWILIIKWINSLNPPITNVMAATGRVRKINVFTACIVTSIIPISILLLYFDCSPVTIYMAMLLLTLFNQYAGVRILCDTFPEVTVGDYLKRIILPCLELSVLAICFPILLKVVMPPSLVRLFITIGGSFIVIILSSFVYFDKEEKTLLKTMLNALLQRIRLKR